MSGTPRVGAFAIVPSNDLAAAIPFSERLGFARMARTAVSMRMPRSGSVTAFVGAARSERYDADARVLVLIIS